MLEKNSIEGSVMNNPLRRKVVSKPLIMDVNGCNWIESDCNVTRIISFINYGSS